MPIIPAQWNDAEPFGSKDLIQLSQFSSHFLFAVKRTIEHVARFQAGHGRRAAPNQHFIGHGSLLLPDID